MDRTKNEATLAYLASCFPALTHTFISREIRGLRDLGVRIACHAIHRPGTLGISREDRSFLDTTEYVFPLNVTGFLRAQLHFLRRAPRGYLRLLFFVVSRPHTGWKNRLRCFFHFLEGVDLAYRMKDRGIVHIHVHFVAGAATAGMVAARLLGRSFSFTAHGTALLVEGLLLREKVEAAKFIVAVSAYNRTYIEKKVPGSGDKIRVIHCGVDPTVFSPTASKKPSPRVRLLSVGSLVWQKGHAFLLEACSILREQGVSLRCLILGEGPERGPLERSIARLRLEDSVILRGAVAQEEIQVYYDEADIFVLPSVSEGLPVVLMEAMAKEIPVVATKITGIPEIVEHGRSGFLVEPGNPREIAQEVLRLVRDPSLGQAMGKRGREKVLEAFDIRANVKKLKQLFQENRVPPAE